MTPSIDLKPGDKIEFAVELETVPGVADSDFLDRLAELVYEIAELQDPLLGLNPDGSIHASFVVPGATSLEAVKTGLQKFEEAFAAAGPVTSSARPLPWGWPAAAVPTFNVVPADRLVRAS
jgi:hypothetical protein